MIMFDTYFLLTTAMIGFGLSLATYRVVALRYDWPMGELHDKAPMVPIVIGLAAFLLGVLFAAQRGTDLGGWLMIALGLVLAVGWTALLRVGSQVSLFLAPAAMAAMVLGSLGAPLPGNYDTKPMNRVGTRSEAAPAAILPGPRSRE